VGLIRNKPDTAFYHKSVGHPELPPERTGRCFKVFNSMERYIKVIDAEISASLSMSGFLKVLICPNGSKINRTLRIFLVIPQFHSIV
jgi:hypothetical protein